ncbi:MAG: hypothetical protein KIT33_15795 [Candidatus Kapabacteria bacterium]|nr:hypothetical protein [Ignavibacteriota bacterium]MCW5886434.1 hypothetical protein [Candidatus Kapabacteria bacterium]
MQASIKIQFNKAFFRKFILFIFIFTSGSLVAKDFSFDFLKGLNTGLTNKRIVEILDSNKMEYSIETNDAGGKYYLIKHVVLFQELEFNEIRIPMLKNKSESIVVLTNNYKDLWKSIDFLSKDAKCVKRHDEKPVHYFIYDNHLIIVNFDSESIAIVKSKQKCK